MNWSISLVALLLTVAQVSAQSTEEAAAICRDAHIQSRVAIKTLRCQFNIQRPGVRSIREPVGTMHPAVVRDDVEFWQDGPTMLSKISRLDGKLIEVFLWKDGVLKIMKTDLTGGRTAEENKNGALLDRQNFGEFIGTLPWFYAQFGVPGPDPPLPTDAKSVKSVVREQHRGADCYRVVSEKEAFRHVAWFRVGVKFLLCDKHTYNVMQGDSFDETIRMESEVSTFQEVKPGIFFPKAIERRDVRGGKSSIIDQVNFMNVQVNEPIDPSVFTLTFPEGTNVTDLRSGVRYRTDANERPIGELSPYVPPAPAGTQLPTYLQKPSRRIWWWVGAGVVLLVALGALTLWRRKRSAGDQ